MPETHAVIATLKPSEICLQHNIRSGAATEADDDAPFALLAGDENDDFITSIVSQGILIRCTVRNTAPCEHGKDYIAIAGHRRITAEAFVRGWDTGEVPVEIVDQDRMLDVVTMLVENLQRTDLNPLDEARGYAELVREHGWKQAEVAASVGRATSHVSERLQLLGLPDEAKDKLVAGMLPIRAALKLAKAPAEVQDMVLREPGTISEAHIDTLIDSARGKVKRAKLKDKALAQLEAEGWNILKSHPEGSVQVVLRGDSAFYSGSPLRLELTRAQFRKEPGVFAVVRVDTYQDRVNVLFGTTAPEQYTGKNAPKADKVAESRKPIKDDSQANVDEVTAHRQAWWQTYLATPVDPKVAQTTLLAIGWRLVHRQAVELAPDLKLVSDEEMGIGPSTCAERLDSYIEGKGSKEQTRVIHLAAMEQYIRQGVSRWDPFQVPAKLTELGYEPHPLEVEAAAKAAERDAADWKEVRDQLDEETFPLLTDEEKAVLNAAMQAAEAAGDDAFEFHHDLIEKATEREAGVETPDIDEYEPDDDAGDDVRYEGTQVDD